MLSAVNGYNHAMPPTAWQTRFDTLQTRTGQARDKHRTHLFATTARLVTVDERGIQYPRQEHGHATVTVTVQPRQTPTRRTRQRRVHGPQRVHALGVGGRRKTVDVAKQTERAQPELRLYLPECGDVARQFHATVSQLSCIMRAKVSHVITYGTAVVYHEEVRIAQLS